MFFYKELEIECDQNILPIIDQIFLGKDVQETYNSLDSIKKIDVCMIACKALAYQLDKAKLDKAQLADAEKLIELVGKFFQNVELENIVISVRTQIGIIRIINWNIDEHPMWYNIFLTIDKKIESN